MHALKVIYIIWLREFKTFIRERSRIVGMIGQPLFYFLIIGMGISSSMSLNGAPAGMDYLKFMYPGIVGMSVLFTAIFSAMSLTWDREFGFMKEVLVAPVPRWGVAVGKSLGGATTAMLQAVILIAMAPIAGIDVSFILVVKLVLMTFLLSFAITSLGVLIASRMTTMQGFQMVMNFLIMPLFFLSGGMFPISTAPAWMKTLMNLDPLTYGVDALRNIVFSNTVVSLGGFETSLVEVAKSAGLIRWSLGYDVAVVAAVAVVLATAAAVSFSTAE